MTVEPPPNPCHAGVHAPTIAANPWVAHTVRIAEVREEIPGVATYSLEFCDPAIAASYRFAPGQFNMLYMPGAGECAISLSADPASRNNWAHTIRTAGNVTGLIARLGVGGTLGLRGPFGTSWPTERCAGAEVIIAAGGIGLAPLRALVYAILNDRSRFGPVTVLYGSRFPEALLYPGEYEQWRQRCISVELTVDRASADWTGNVGAVPLLVDRLAVANPANTVLLTCGPEIMMKYTIQAAVRKGVPVENTWVSLERNMQCALGFCGHCQLGPAFICKDGPVFRYDQIEPYLRVEAL